MKNYILRSGYLVQIYAVIDFVYELYYTYTLYGGIAV